MELIFHLPSPTYWAESFFCRDWRRFTVPTCLDCKPVRPNAHFGQKVTFFRNIFALFQCLISPESYHLITTKSPVTILMRKQSHTFRFAGVEPMRYIVYGPRRYFRVNRIVLFFVQQSIINFSTTVRHIDGQFGVFQNMAFHPFDPCPHVTVHGIVSVQQHLENW